MTTMPAPAPPDTPPLRDEYQACIRLERNLAASYEAVAASYQRIADAHARAANALRDARDAAYPPAAV